MGLFRPARTATGPRGEYWELYVSKTALPAWREGKAGSFEDGFPDPRGSTDVRDHLRSTGYFAA